MKKAAVEKKACVSCGVCTKVCPMKAISVYKGCYAVVDVSLCIGCGLCERNCPTGAVQTKVVS